MPRTLDNLIEPLQSCVGALQHFLYGAPVRGARTLPNTPLFALFDSGGFEAAKQNLWSNLLTQSKYHCYEIPRSTLTQIESELDLGKIMSIRFGHFNEEKENLYIHFGENSQSFLKLSSSRPFEKYALDREFQLTDKQYFEYSIIWLNPRQIELSAPALVRAVGNLAAPQTIYYIKPNGGVTSEQDKNLQSFNLSVGPFLKDNLRKVLPLLKGFHRDDFFNPLVHHTPAGILGEVLYRFWSDDGPINKINSDFYKCDKVSQIEITKLLEKQCLIEQAIKEAYSGLPAYIKHLPVPEIAISKY